MVMPLITKMTSIEPNKKSKRNVSETESIMVMVLMVDQNSTNPNTDTVSSNYLTLRSSNHSLCSSSNEVCVSDSISTKTMLLSKWM